jgi:hypothetical protein
MRKIQQTGRGELKIFANGELSWNGLTLYKLLFVVSEVWVNLFTDWLLMPPEKILSHADEQKKRWRIARRKYLNQQFEHLQALTQSLSEFE